MTDSAFEDLVADALALAPEVAGLDGARAEAWASDLLALAAELGDESGDRLVAALVAASDDRAATTLAALAGIAAATVGAWSN